MASTPCGVDTSIEAIKSAKGDLNKLFGPGASDKFAEIESKAADLGAKLEAKMPKIEQNPSLQKALQKLNGANPLSALTTITEIQNDFGPLVSDLQDILGEVSPDLQSIAGDVEGFLGSGGGAIGDLQKSLSGGDFSSLLSKASSLTKIDTATICNNCKNLEIKTLPDGTKTAVELPPPPKVPELKIEPAPISESMSGSGSFKPSLLAARRQLYVSTHPVFAKYFSEAHETLKKYYVDNEWKKAELDSGAYGKILTKDLQTVDISIDPFDPANSDKLNGLEPQQYKNTQQLKIGYRKKYLMVARQWIIDSHEIANSFKEIVPYEEYFELAESIISEDEIESDGPQPTFQESGLGSIHALRDKTRDGFALALAANGAGVFMSFNYYIYNKIREENGLGLDEDGLGV